MKENKEGPPGRGWVSMSFAAKVWALPATVTLCPHFPAAIINDIPQTKNNPAPCRKPQVKENK